MFEDNLPGDGIGYCLKAWQDFVTLTDEEFINLNRLVEYRKTNRKIGIGSMVMVVETGEVFKSQAACARALKTTGANVSNGIKNGRKIKGCTVRRI